MCEPPPPVNPKTSAQLCGYETGTNVFLTFNTCPKYNNNSFMLTYGLISAKELKQHDSKS